MTIARILAEHDGVITMPQALASGLSRSSVQRKIARGEWIAQARSVYRAADHPMSLRVRVRVAVASVGPGAVLCGEAAAWWHGLTQAVPTSFTVVAPRRGRHAGAVRWASVCHRQIGDVDIVERDGLCLNAIPFTVLDSAIELGAQVLDNALLLDRVTLQELAEVHARYPRRAGVGRARTLLASLESGARSAAERLAVQVFDHGGISGWRANQEVCGYLADFVFDEKKVIVEIDGFAFHRDAKTFQRDRTKRNAWTAAGYTTLNFTWDDLDARPDQVVETVERAFSA
ncbi:type IV toxin-antitoxin system AbiEi family antitoxin domain-containing protein [Gordonia sp. CPCC 205515]|uniref:DUF559 domain-containing protein n=1 Tax=Gordonia sp. CPCC 205515 TaxID=3140791 RepID=UPI003AF35B98